MIVDSYVHLGLPRFQSIEDELAVMRRYSIDKAIVCPFESCPDLEMVHRAFTANPERFRGAGLPIGADRTEMTAGLNAQFEAGFGGIRLSGGDVAERPWLLDVIGENHGFALVCGSDGLSTGAEALLRYVDRYDDALVVGGHFAGPTDTSIFESNGAVSDLFSHDKFTVVMSRQGHFLEPLISDWAHALIELVGWDRLLWGSEAPVLYWRDDSVGHALSWFEKYNLDEATSSAFFGGNADRLVFGRPVAAPSALKLPFDPWKYDLHNLVPTWPFGLQMATELVGPLVHGWMEWGGTDRGPLREYLGEILEKNLL